MIEATGPWATELGALVEGRNANPFAVLGRHREGGQFVVRCFQPQARAVELLDRKDKLICAMEKTHEAGIFSAPLPPRLLIYRLRVTDHKGRSETLDDPYRFPSLLGDLDLHLLSEGTHAHLYQKLGSHLIRHKGVDGCSFSVWAPNASRVSVIGDFNQWDGRRHVMRLHPGNGIWEIFIPGVVSGAHYKFEMLDSKGQMLPLKFDPVGQYHESPPGNASIVYESRYRWRDAQWMSSRSMTPRLDGPMCIYEVHLGSWRRVTEEGRSLSYRELARELVTYVHDMGFTHVELMPVSEHPFDGSWGYQPIGLFAATQRFGKPDELRFLIDEFHKAGIAVIVDWVSAHFPKDDHGLAQFDGTALYEHADPRLGQHADWGTLIFNYGRQEVFNYLISSAIYWIREFHIDALRVDAVASMLYLDYSRKEGEWLPNKHGGNENLEVVEFLKRLNQVVHLEGAGSHAEESTSWTGVSRPVESGGLGFTCKWNMGWMNDTLSYMSEEPVHRKHHHDKMTFGLHYAFSENFILPLSHDEVVHGKGSLLSRMPGDEWHRFANLRAYLAFMYAHPGKKLLFMGSELAQYAEWNHDSSLDWHLLEYTPHRGMQTLVREMNHCYRASPALFEVDFDQSGFEWIDFQDRDNSVLAWLRFARDERFVVCVCNFTPVVRETYRLGVPQAGKYRIILNTDSSEFGGSGLEQDEIVEAEQRAVHGREHSIVLTLPPLATLWLELIP